MSRMTDEEVINLIENIGYLGENGCNNPISIKQEDMLEIAVELAQHRGIKLPIDPVQ